MQWTTPKTAKESTSWILGLDSDGCSDLRGMGGNKRVGELYDLSTYKDENTMHIALNT